MKYVALDVETGGIGHDKSLLTAYFGVYDEDFNKTNELYLKIKPEDKVYHMTAESLSVNKINIIEHDKIAITEKEAGAKLYEFLNAVSMYGSEKLIPVGHNVSFDMEFIKSKIISGKTWSQFVSYRLLDTGVLGQALRAINKIPADVSGSLESLAKFYNIEQRAAHTADNDVEVTVNILKAMLDSIS